MFFYRLVVRLLCYLTDRLPSLEQATLLRLLSVAVSNSVSQSGLLRSFANDLGRGQAKKILRTADRLDEGASLADALEQSPGLLRDADLASVRFGSEMGTLSESLKAATREVNAATEDAVQRVTDTFVYLSALALFASLIVTFLMIKVVPTLNMIFLDFDMSPPAPFEFLITCAESVARYWYLFFLGLVLLGLYVVTGQLSRDLRQGWIGRLLLPGSADGTLCVLDQLAIAKEAGRPLTGAISTLARYHNNQHMRHKLLYVRNELEQGTPVWSSFAAAKVISAAEADALRLADVVGNTPWVIRQLAAKRRTRQSGRLQVFAQLLFPTLILCMALVVGFIALSLFASIISIPSNLT